MQFHVYTSSKILDDWILYYNHAPKSALIIGTSINDRINILYTRFILNLAMLF